MNIKLNKSLRRMVVALLIVAVALPIISISVTAEGENKTAAVSVARFMTGEMQSENATLAVNPDTSVKLKIVGKSPTSE